MVHANTMANKGIGALVSSSVTHSALAQATWWSSPPTGVIKV